MKTHSYPQKGFTLTALTIVLVVMGLLIGGVLAGYAMIENAKVVGTVTDIKNITGGTLAFYDQFEGYPGDINDALSSVPGCSSVTYCANGDGDGAVGDRINSATDIDTTPDVAENIQFWKQLSLAGFIRGVQPGASSQLEKSAFGETNPPAAVGGGWNAIMTDQSEITEYGAKGIVFELSPIAGKTSLPTVRAAIARRIDTMLDDGKPNSGRVTAESSDNGCEDDAANSYVVTSDAPVCQLYVDGSLKF
jgi:hypothetical protein